MNQIQTVIPREVFIPTRLQSNFYISRSLADNTKLAYEYDLKHFVEHGGFLPATPEIIVNYLTENAARIGTDTLKRRKCTISKWHQLNGFDDPTRHRAVEMLMRGIRREHGKPIKRAKPFTIEHLKKISEHLKKTSTTHNIRNRAMILIGFCGALRRSELLAIQYEHLEFIDNRLEIFLPRSKTDQFNNGKKVAIHEGKDIAFCPVSALIHWISTARINSGLIFRKIRKGGYYVYEGEKTMTGRGFSSLLKKLAGDCGIDGHDLFSGHSMRRGYVTEATIQGRSPEMIAKHGRWKKASNVYDYIDDEAIFNKNAKEGIL